MNIAVVAPHLNKTGVTTVSCLLGLEFSNRGKTVCITHASERSESMYQYFDLDKRDDRTANTDRLIKLIKQEVITPDEFADYCKSVKNKLDVFSVYSGMDVSNKILADGEEGEIIPDDSASLRGFIVEHAPYDYMIYDIDTDIEDDNARYYLSKADVVINVFNQDVINLQKYRKDIRKINKVIKDKPQLVVLNQYDDISGDVKKCASMMGLKKANNWHCLRYNSWIRYATNNGKLRKLYDGSMLKGDIRVLDITKDIKNIANAVQKVKIAARKQVIEVKKNK